MTLHMFTVASMAILVTMTWPDSGHAWSDGV